jgi:hypothetical protein
MSEKAFVYDDINGDEIVDYEEDEDEKEEQEKEEQEKTEDEEISLRLGDIVEILAASNPDLHESSFFIEYIDDEYISLVNITTLNKYPLNIDEYGKFTDESIQEMNILLRAKEEGYARQNRLVPGTWIELHINATIRVTITGEIIDLEEDQIKIITYPDMKVIYVNFDYKGIPKDIPFEKIVIREKPAKLDKIGSLKDIQGLDNTEIEDLAAREEDISIEYLDSGEAVIRGVSDSKSEPNFRETLHNLYRSSQSIVILEDLGDIIQLVELPESQQRYSVDVQVNSIVDELLSTIPNASRSKSVMNRVHLLVERYKELRLKFSRFDENDNIRSFLTKDYTYKPIVKRLEELDVRLKWIIPVVETQRKLYNIESYTDESLIINDVLKEDIATQNRVYYENKSGEENRYLSLYQSLEDSMRPFQEQSNHSSYLTNKRVGANIEAIIQETEDFYSKTVYQAHSFMRRFVIESYNLGLSKLETGFSTEDAKMTNATWRRCTEGGKRTTVRIDMTPADKMAIKSLIVLPKSVVQYSKLYLPSTNILDRTNLHQTQLMLFRVLRKNLKSTDIIQHIVDDLDKEIDYETLEKETGIGFLSKTTEFILEESKWADPNKFRKFLSTIFPKTKLLINFIKPQLKNKLSVTTVMDALEPFLVYSEDITYGHYANDIRRFIKDRITEIKAEFQARLAIFNHYRNYKFNITPAILTPIRIFKEKPELLERFLALYEFKGKDEDQKRTSNEMINQILHTDQSTIFTTLLSTMMISLRTPDNLSILKDEIEDMGEIERIKPTDCSQKIITKLYSSINELMKDNHNSDIFYDKDYDNTPYSILKKYEEDQKKRLPDKFLSFLEENLIQKHECPREMANELAKTMIEGKKRVKEGEYAIVEIKPTSENKDREEEDEGDIIESDARKKTLYFQRKKDVWIQDKDVDETMFIDSSILFSNMSKKCAVKQSRVGDSVEEVKDTKRRLMDDSKKKALKEFDRRYQVSLEDLKTRLEKELTERIRFIQRLTLIKDVQLKRTNNLEYEYGRNLQVIEAVRSPYESLLELILEQEDFSKKQEDIVRFAAKFTRDPIRGFVDSLENEEPFWKYCKETNVKLLPDFLLILAQEYCNGGDYNEKLNELCVPERIEIVGNRVVDKVSGRTMKFVDFSDEEGYNDAGFKVSTNAVLEISTLEQLTKFSENQRIFKDETTEKIYNIISAVCRNIDIPIETVEENVLRISVDMMQDRVIVASEEGYAKRLAKNEKKQGKKLAPYPMYRNEMMIIISVSVLIACIQSINGLKTIKTFPGCIRSFSGYPFGGIEDLSTIEYFACVLDKMRNETIDPWNAIYKVNREGLSDRIKTICTVSLNNNDILELFQEKRDYLILNPEEENIPVSLQISGWKQFLPPIGKLDIIKHLQPISQTFKNDFLELMQKGDKSQTEDFLVLKSKIIQYTVGIIQSIQEVVDSKNVLLKTMSNIPFLQNACCNEEGASMRPLDYFIKEQSNIEQYLKIVSSIISTVDNTNRISKAGAMYDPRRSGTRMVTNNQYSSEPDVDTIYAAFIYYCGLDKTGFILPEFRNFFTEIPEKYNKRNSLAEKIVVLKQEGKQFGQQELSSLMTIIRKKNRVDRYSKPRYTFVGVIRDILSNLDRNNSTVIEEPLRRHIDDCLNDYSPTRLRAIEPDSPQKVLEDLKNYLSTTNNRMYIEIINFIRDFGKPNERRLKNIMNFLDTTRTDCEDSNRKYSLQSWQLDCDMEKTGTYYDNGLNTIFQFTKQSIHQMTHVFPEIILNNVTYTTIPKHWELGEKDELFMMGKVNDYFATLNRFKEDRIISRILQEIRLRNVDLYLFLSNLPVHTPIVKDGVTYYSIFDKPAILQIILYVFYSVLHEYILLAYDENMLHIDRIEHLNVRRRENYDRMDSEGGLFSNETDMDEGLFEENDRMMEIQIESGEREDLKRRIANLMMAYIDIIQVNKTMVDYSYDQIAADIRSSKMKEKMMIIGRLEKQSIEERRVENMMKTYRLGKWNVGQQKGLYIYDEKTQDRERQDLLEQGVQDKEDLYRLALGELDIDGTTNAVTTEEIDLENEKEADIEINNEFLDISHLGQDYDEGYGGDNEPGDFEDT